MAKEVKKTEKETEGKEGAVERAAPSRALSPFEEMERAFEDYFPRGWIHRWGWPTWGEMTSAMERAAPRIDIIERDGEVVVRAELPGVDKDDLDISLTENSVTIKGSKRSEKKEEKGDYFRSEITRGQFLRTVALPSLVDPDKAEASFKDGVLELKIAKVSKANRRSIKID